MTAGGRDGTAVPAAPEAARLVFGEHLAVAEHYAALLCGPGSVEGHLGPREGERIWERHLLNSAAIHGLLGSGERVVDLGSGAGLPGIPLWLARPDLDMVLLEPMLRRSDFLRRVLAELQLDAIGLVRGRAEEIPPLTAGVVVARAVARLDSLWAWGAPHLGEDGRLLALKGHTAEQELATCLPALRRAGVIHTEIESVAAAVGTPATLVVTLIGSPRPPRRRGHKT